VSIGFSVFKRRRNGETGKRWTIRLRLADGRTEERVGFTDKAATQQLASQLLREAERKEVGLHDQFAGARKTPLLEHLAGFLRSMENGTLTSRRNRGRPTSDWVEKVEARLKKLFLLLGASRIEQLNVAAAEAALSLEVAAGWSAKTRDDHAALLRQFGNWLVDDQRWATNPFARLRSIGTAATKTFVRHAFTLAELGAIVDAAEQRALQEYREANPMAKPQTLEAKRRAGWERGVLYQVAAYTGLRRGEITKVVWSDLELDGDSPALVVRPEIAKNRKRARIELPRWLAALLVEVRQSQGKSRGRPSKASEIVFGASYRHLTERLKADAVWAQIGREVGGRVVNDAGAVLDFHALRVTLATLAAEIGMPAKHLQELMRHSDIRLTMEVYTRVRSGAMRTEVERLPQPTKPGEPLPPPAPPRERPELAGDCRSTETGATRRGVAT
jgi:integrase